MHDGGCNRHFAMNAYVLRHAYANAVLRPSASSSSACTLARRGTCRSREAWHESKTVASLPQPFGAS